MPRPSLTSSGDRQESPEVKLAIGLFRIGQALANARGQAAAQRGVSPLQLQVLIDLHQEAAGAATAAELARRYGLSAPTLSDSLATLARRKLIARKRRAGDARALELGLTERGRRLARQALEELDALVDVAAAMAPLERERALGTTVDLIRRFNELGWIRADRLCVTCRFFERDRHQRAAQPHRCRLIERRLGPSDLRVDCPEHEPIPETSET